MSLSNGVRQTHRWLSIAFTAGLVVNLVALAKVDPAHPEPPPFWVGLLALLPLVLLELTGIYLFVLPYAARLRGGRSTD